MLEGFILAFAARPALHPTADVDSTGTSPLIALTPNWNRHRGLISDNLPYYGSTHSVFQMTSLTRLFWKLHKNDESASRRWVVIIALPLSFMTIFGSWIAILALGAGIVAWLYKIISPDRFRFNRRDLVIAAIYTFYILITILFSVTRENPVEGLRQSTKLLPFLIILPLLPVLRDAYQDYWMKWILGGIIISGIATGLIAITVNFIQFPERIELLAGNPLIFSYLVAIISLANLLVLTYARGFWGAVLGAATILSFIALVLSGSRAPIAIYLAAASFMLAVRLVDEISVATSRTWAIAVILIVVPPIAIFSLSKLIPLEQSLKDYEAIFTTVAGNNTNIDVSTSERISMIRAGFSAFIKQPFTGYGRQNVIIVANAQYPDDMKFSYTHLHNAFLTDAVASGLPGLVAFTLMLLTPLIVVAGLPSPFPLAAVTFTIFVAAYHTFNIGFYHDITAINFALVTVFLGCIPPPRQEMSHDSRTII